MPIESTSQLARYFASIGEAAVATQRRLDAAGADDLEVFTTSVAPHLARLDPALVTALAPPRQVVTEMSCTAHVDVTLDRSAGFALTVAPFGAGVSRRFASSTTTASSFSVSVITASSFLKST